MSAKTLFDEVKVGKLTLKNRLLMNPMTRSRADENGVATSIMVEYYQQRSTAGLIVTEGIAPSPNGKGYARIPGLWNQAQIDSWKPITAAVHARGGNIFAQFMHTGRVSHPINMIEGGQVVAPSAVALTGSQMHTDAKGPQDYPVPTALDAAGLASTKAEFVTAAKNAIAAGFDGIELHAANGYLLEQFLSPHTNTRADNYGGSIENRIRFVVEVAKATAEAIGADKVGIRISPYGVASGMQSYPEVEAEYLLLLKELAAIGLVYVHVADHQGQGAPEVPMAFKQALRKAWNSTFIIGGSFDQASAQKAVEDGLVDLPGLGRAFLANPDLVERFKKNLPLNAPDYSTLFTPGTKGYTDYPLAVATV